MLITFGIGCHAFNEFAINAALPLALAEIGGLRLINWVYGLYFIGALGGGVAGAALGRRFGPRRALMAAAALFLLGMGVATLAGSAPVLILGRGLQGVGDGVIWALCYGLIPQAFPAALVPRVFSVEAMVWAVAALVGPLAGGAATEAFSWRAAMPVAAPMALAVLVLAPLVAPRRMLGEAASLRPMKFTHLSCGD